MSNRLKRLGVSLHQPLNLTRFDLHLALGFTVLLHLLLSLPCSDGGGGGGRQIRLPLKATRQFATGFQKLFEELAVFFSELC